MNKKECDFEKDFELLRQNIISLCVEWDFYKSLYSNEKNINILNKSASFFFNRLQIMLIDAITLKIGNLLDKKETIKVSDVVNVLNVERTTIYRDFKHLIQE